MTQPQKRSPLRRWGNVFLRALHLAAVIALGAGLLGAPVKEDMAAAGVALSGLAMLILDTWGNPGHLREVSGIAVMAKLAFVAWMAADESRRPLLFWGLVVGSTVFAHAPARFRHAVVL